MKLNKAQQQVVEHQKGPMLVVAGAGTGKTMVIVKRIQRLLNDGIPAQRILAVTFTEKAAAEMLERVLEITGHIRTELQVLTFNAFGESILRKYSTDAGLRANFLLMGESAKLVFLQQQLDNLELDYYSPITNPESLLPDVAEYFSKLKQHLIMPEVYSTYAKKLPTKDSADKLEKKRHLELASAYKNYLRLCEVHSVIDYDDQIFRVIQLLQSHPNVLQELQNTYHSIMIDEFQDTNPMQSKLIDLLMNKQQNLMVVGDDDQSIYGFRGATLANILEFNNRYPKSKNISLTENYRSTQAILDASHKLIQHNNPERLEVRLGISKRLKSLKAGSPPELKQFENLESELYWIGEDIAAKIKNGSNPGDIAVLCRRNIIAEQVSQSLTLAGINHVVIGEKYQLYKTPIVRLLVEALKAVVDPKADISLHHTLTGPLFKVSNIILAELLSTTRRQHEHLEMAIMEQENKSEWADAIKAINIIRAWRAEAAELSVGRLVYKMIDESGYKDKLYQDALGSPEAALSVTQLSEFFRTLKEFESIALQPTALQYIEAFPVLAAAGESSEDSTLEISSDRVNILTIHKAKGLEWETVYIPDCTEGSFPLRARGGGINIPETLQHNTSSAADEHIAEERRLMYVALTRAKHNVLLSYSERHFTPTPRKPSRFISELFETLPEQNKAAKPSETRQFTLFAPFTGEIEPINAPRSMLDGGILKLSVSQIVTYLNCPLDFYYRYILNIPEPPTAATIYGTALHGVIETINKALYEQEFPSLKQLQHDLQAGWPKDGYLSISHRNRSLKQAIKTLENFYALHVIKAPRRPHLVEWPFAVSLQPENLVVRGRYDVVYNDDGTEIRDYKTTLTADTPEKAKRRTTSSEQLTLYAVVWQALHNELPTKLSLEFVDTGLIGEVRKTQRSIDSMRSKLSVMAEQIKAGSFKPGVDHRRCRHPQQ